MFEKYKDKLLKFLGCSYGEINVFQMILQDWLKYLVRPDELFERGKEIEKTGKEVLSSFDVYEEAEPYYRRACELGHSRALVRVGRHHEDIGLHTIAAEYYWKAAEKRNEEGMRAYIRNYTHIMRGEEDRFLTRKKRERLAACHICCCGKLLENGDARALIPLAGAYLAGDGVPRDLEKSTILFEQSLDLLEMRSDLVERIETVLIVLNRNDENKT